MSDKITNLIKQNKGENIKIFDEATRKTRDAKYVHDGNIHAYYAPAVSGDNVQIIVEAESEVLSDDYRDAMEYAITGALGSAECKKEGHPKEAVINNAVCMNCRNPINE